MTEINSRSWYEMSSRPVLFLSILTPENYPGDDVDETFLSRFNQTSIANDSLRYENRRRKLL